MSKIWFRGIVVTLFVIAGLFATAALAGQYQSYAINGQSQKVNQSIGSNKASNLKRQSTLSKQGRSSSSSEGAKQEISSPPPPGGPVPLPYPTTSTSK